MKIEIAANQLLELGHVTRLSIYQFLVKAGRSGSSVADVQNHLEIPASTLSHHLSRLINVNLIQQIREGRVLRCVAQFETLDILIGFLRDECCSQECC